MYGKVRNLERFWYYCANPRTFELLYHRLDSIDGRPLLAYIFLSIPHGNSVAVLGLRNHHQTLERLQGLEYLDTDHLNVAKSLKHMPTRPTGVSPH